MLQPARQVDDELLGVTGVTLGVVVVVSAACAKADRAVLRDRGTRESEFGRNRERKQESGGKGGRLHGDCSAIAPDHQNGHASRSFQPLRFRIAALQKNVYIFVMHCTHEGTG